MEEIKYELQKINEIYIDLLMQRDKANSKVLYELLNREISCYVLLSEVTKEYVDLLSEKISRKMKDNQDFLHNSLDDIKDIDNLKNSLTILNNVKNTYEVLCDLNDVSITIMFFVIQNYKNICSRNFKDWETFAKLLMEEVFDIVGCAIPIVSDLKSMYDYIKRTAELMNEYEKNETDYSDIDKKIFEIEKHIQLMEETTLLFTQSVDLLKSSKRK